MSLKLSRVCSAGFKPVVFILLAFIFVTAFLMKNEKTNKIGLIVFAIIAPKGRNKIAQGNAHRSIHIRV